MVRRPFDPVVATAATGQLPRGGLPSAPGALIGADGFHSAVQGRPAELDDARDGGHVCWLGIVPFAHSRFTGGYVGHYWGSGQRFGLIDIGHGRAYWWGPKNMPAQDSHRRRGGKETCAPTPAGRMRCGRSSGARGRRTSSRLRRTRRGVYG
ncbi:hypothetical protein [Streptomyces violaceusniger]|uniref:FAD-binding domain-containing protein n=1 Tax=Streptomyces violaceusniger TaxID=68280 RepID=A0A4D4LP52_STRVO|nr:hypothetical protein SVIO_104660 [Streptomyces violaceusniger]